MIFKAAKSRSLTIISNCDGVKEDLKVQYIWNFYEQMQSSKD